jgi:protein-S-isoprenylcysteine O-methyltransferase Ste14
MNTSMGSTGTDRRSNPFPLRTVIIAALYLVLMPVVLIGLSGRWDWGMGWAYFIVVVGAWVGARLIILRRNPDLLVERARRAAKARGQERALLGLITTYGPLLAWITAALDQCNGWSSQVVPALQAIGLIMVIAGNGLIYWAMIVNQFFSSTVRLQTDRGQVVVSSGPYQFVRHPGYVGGILMYLVTPLALNSLWSAIPAALIIAGLLIRTRYEDPLLQKELAGYKDYARQVRYRLLPGVW